MSLEIKVDWPDKESLYKVVQIEANGEEHILIIGALRAYHSTMLGRFLEKRGLTPVWREYKDIRGKTKNLPSLEGEYYRVLGMGRTEINPEEKKAQFFGCSGDYNFPIDSSQIERLKRQYPDWDIEFIEGL